MSLSSTSACIQNIIASTPTWKLVRHVPQGTKWHPATDKLARTDEYGDPGIPSQPFSVKWNTENYNQVGV